MSEKPSVDLWRKDDRPRREWEALENKGLCPECGCGPKDLGCPTTCRKRFFDWAYSLGFHDGANNLPRYDWAYVVAMMDNGCYRGEEE